MKKKILLILLAVLIITTGVVSAMTPANGVTGTSSWAYGWASTSRAGYYVWVAVELYHSGDLVAQNSNSNVDYVYTQTSTTAYNKSECTVTSLHQSY